MRRLILLVYLVAPSAAWGQPLPPAPPNYQLSPPAAVTSPPVSGDTVRVLRDTVVRSAASDQAYTCIPLLAGERVVLLEPPTGRSPYAIITAPEKCLSLIPAKAVESGLIVRGKITNFHKEYVIRVKPGVMTLVEGTLPAGGDYVESGTVVPHGAFVTVVGAKQAVVHGKKGDYYLIKSHGKEKRYVLAEHLEGVQAVAPKTYTPAQPPAQFPSIQVPAQLPPSPLTQIQYAPTSEQSTLPPAVESQVRAAEQAYSNAVRDNVWEDARLRYVQLLDSDISSVRILAINRLEFIRQHQANPQTIVTRLPQQNTMQPASSPPINTEFWVPGSKARVPVAAPPAPTNPTKDVTIRPATPPSSAATPPPASPSRTTKPALPTYPPQPTTPPAATPPQASIRRDPPAGQLASTNNAAQKVTRKGRLYRAVQTDGLTQLYYLANSQAMPTYYVRAWTNSRLNLASFEGKVVEVEGQLIDRRRDELGAYQINVDAVREVR